MRVGIVGAGAIARVHTSQWQKLPVEIAGCYDRHFDRAETFCRQFGGRAYASLDELLSNVDLVTICTHTDGHHEAVIAAARARVPVVCEKPLARTMRQAQEMVAACEATGTPLFVAQVLRFFPAFAQAKAILDSGAIGTPGVIRSTRAGSFPREGAPFSSPFYADFPRSGGVTLDLAIHDIDFHRWLVGDVERVFARGLAYSGVANADQSYILLRFSTGAIGHIDVNWSLPPGLSRSRFEIAGDQGLLEWDSMQPAPLIAAFNDTNYASQIEVGPSGIVSAQDEPYYAQLAHVLTCLKDNRPFMVSPHDALMALKVALAALESIRSGQPIELANFEEVTPCTI